MNSGEAECYFLNGLAPRTKVKEKKAPESPRAYSQAEYGWATDSFALYSSYISLTDKAILDAGCGLGGKTVYYAQKGCKSIVGVDMDERHVEYSRQFARENGVSNAEFRTAELSSLPFESDGFDIIFLNDVVEHIRRPAIRDALAECKRVVKPDGRICLEFPPWTVWNAAYLDDYIRIPWCHVFFSDETLINVMKRMDLRPGFGRLSIIEHFSALNRITVTEFTDLVKQLCFKVIHADVRMLRGKDALRHIPYLNKYLIYRFVAVLSK